MAAPGTTIRRLQLAHLFLGMMFWYGIEQLFLNKYLGTSSARAYLTMVFTGSLLLFDIPGGILADKFGRKKTLLLACLAQAIGLAVLGSSRTLAQYLLGTVIFGIFLSLMNGAAQALLYDHLLLNQAPGQYGKQQGRMYALFLIGAGVANFASGFIAQSFGLRAPFFISLVPSLLAFAILLPVSEPPLSKNDTKWYAHLHEVYQEIRARPRILLFGVQFVTSVLVLFTIGEFGQIYILSFGVSTVALGILWSIDALFAAGGRFYAHHMQSRPRGTVLAYCAALLMFSLVHSPIGILLFWIVYGANEALANIAETEIQHETKSAMRATLFSSVSFCGNVLALPAIYLFNRLYVEHSIYTADAAMAIAGTVILVASVALTSQRRKPADPAVAATEKALV